MHDFSKKKFQERGLAIGTKIITFIEANMAFNWTIFCLVALDNSSSINFLFTIGLVWSVCTILFKNFKFGCVQSLN
jgi:hypothetical protein